MQAFNSYLCSTLHVAHAHRMRGNRWADDPAAIAAMQRKVPESVAACYELIEANMLGGPWVMGETYTICDPYLFTMAQWLEQDGVDPSRFPKVIDHRRRMSERPASSRGHRRGTRLSRAGRACIPARLVPGLGMSSQALDRTGKIGPSRNTRHETLESAPFPRATVCLWPQRPLNR